MLRIDRYILREMLPPFVAGTFVFVAVILANTIIQSSDAILQMNARWQTIFWWLFYRLPFILVFALPVGAMLATSLVVIRLGRGHEIIPLRLGGMSVRRLFVPFYLAGGAVSLFALLVGEFVVPWALSRANEIELRTLLMQPVQLPESNATFRAGGESYCHVGRVDIQKSEMAFVLIYRFERGRPTEALTAAQCLRVGQQWQLQRGRHTWFDADGGLVRSETFESMPVQFAANLVELWDQDKDPQQLTIRQSLQRLRLLVAAGDTANAVRMRYFLHTKFAMPLSCLIFTLLAAPLSLRFARPKTHPFLGVLLTIIVVFFANGTINWAKTLTLAGSGAWFSPPVGAWLHVVVFGGLAAALIALCER